MIVFCIVHGFFAAILHLVSFPIYKSFLHKNITLVNFIFHNAENGTRCPFCPLNGLNISCIQYFCNVRAVHALNNQIINFPDNGRFWFFCPIFSIFIFFISIRSFQIGYDFAILNTVLISHLGTLTCRFTFCLCKCCQYGKQQFSRFRKRIDVLQFKKNTDISFLQLSGSFQNNCGISGKP